jgi:hypothetical protein
MDASQGGGGDSGVDMALDSAGSVDSRVDVGGFDSGGFDLHGGNG